MALRTPPQTASVAHQGDDARLFAPSATRNAPALCQLLDQVAPPSGTALELASGTGQHVIAFATSLPGLHWQPSEPDAARRASIDAHTRAAQLPNVAPARALDACAPGWARDHAGQSLIVVINLLHLISTPEAETLIAEAARALAPGGRFVIYGPFLRAGALTSDGDARFHASLIAEDPEIGYKDDFDVLDMITAAGLDVIEVIEMPANNLAFVTGRPAI